MRVHNPAEQTCHARIGPDKLVIRPDIARGPSRMHCYLGPMKTTQFALLFALLFACAALHAGEEMPKGPPWQKDFVKAHQEAVEKNLPIFLYFTKTY